MSIIPRKVLVKLASIIFISYACLYLSSVAHANTRVVASSNCNQDWTHGAYFGYEDSTVHFADVNGDGKADAIVVNGDGVHVRLSTGNSFASQSNWTGGAYFGDMDGTVHFADVNGDGRADAIVVNDNGVYVRLSTGSSFGPNQKWTQTAYYGNVDDSVQFADVNGDGKADAIVTNVNNITTVRLATYNTSTGIGNFGPNQTWSQDADLSWIQYADVTGDGKADAVTEDITGNTGTGIYVEVSNSYQFTGGSKWTTDAYAGDVDDAVHYADVNGDRKADAIVVNLDTVTVRLSNGQQFGC